MATGETRETMADLIAEYIATRGRDTPPAKAGELGDRLLFALKEIGPVLAHTPPGTPPGKPGTTPGGGMSVFRYEDRAMGPYASTRTPAIVWADEGRPGVYRLAWQVAVPPEAAQPGAISVTHGGEEAAR